MKTTLFLFSIAISTFLCGCKSFEIGRENMHTIPLVPREYDIVGTIRAEAASTKKEVTYDGILKSAREKYGADVDVINIRIDKMAKLFKKMDYLIINAYVIRYK